MENKDGKLVWLLESVYRDIDRDPCGIYETPRAMAVGLSRCIVNDHPEMAHDKPYELAGLVAALVFDLFYTGTGDSEECRDGSTVYSYDVQNLQGLVGEGAK